ncbi:MAG TPA: histidinol-phosphate transaminase [Pyrinomonadaceae bacterium]|nr:histidinol-phosphate transaminase [Pyrinomonadaceae bacterium]
MFDPLTLARDNIRDLRPYSSARHEFDGAADVFLDANENAFGSPVDIALNRYPDPLSSTLKNRLAEINGVNSDQIFVGNGSDEAIDLLLRIFCEPRKDRVMTFPPTYGMYKVFADINAVGVDEVCLTTEFALDLEEICRQYTSSTKVMFICSPNNPTGNSLAVDDVLEVVERFGSIVVVDEAYIHFSERGSLKNEIDRFPNLVVLQTFSKAWGLAGARVGLALADSRIIDLMNRVKPPYNVNEISQRLALDALVNTGTIDSWVEEIKDQRSDLGRSLGKFGFVKTVFPSDANFLLVKVDDADAIYKFLLKQGIVVRNRNGVERCEGCLRVTVGTPNENSKLLKALSHYRASMPRSEETRQI